MARRTSGEERRSGPVKREPTKRETTKRETVKREATEGEAEVETVGLRDRKAAQTRLALADALGARLETRALFEITVDELASAAGVSRMTFFNHFPTKEHALDHLFQLWIYREQCGRRDRGLRGVAAIEHVFEAMAERVAEAPGRARQIMAWFAARPPELALEPLTRADRELVSTTRAHEPLVFGREALPALAAEAREVDGARFAGTDYEMGHMLGVLLFGGAVVGHSNPTQDWRALYRHHVRRALGIDLPSDAKRATKKKNDGRVRRAPETPPDRVRGGRRSR